MQVIGTAGHVDHGKSALVEAITGIHPDRLKEEREREMTIDLGFAWLTLPGGEEIGIVDVPGHRDFIENMLAGVGGIDAVILVIAADEGVMPQTREHLAILDLLQIQSGLVALTKIDLITDHDWLDLVEDDIRKLLIGTTLENAPIYRVSSKTKDGIPELINGIEQCVRSRPLRINLGKPRLPVDRVFTMPGFGTVVTGTLNNGSFMVGDEIEILPSGNKGRIRGLQTHRKKVETVYPGSRTAINISGVDLGEISRGEMVVKPSTYQPSRLIDVFFRLLPDAGQPLKHDNQVKLFIGSSETLARVRLLGKEKLTQGEEGWLQLETNHPIVAFRGDRFILRRPSPGETIGGGFVVDALPQTRYKRFSLKVLDRLNALAQGAPEDVIQQTVQESGALSFREIIERTNLEEQSALQIINQLIQNGILKALGSLESGSGIQVISAELITTVAYWEYIQKQILDEISKFHQLNPLKLGMPREELRSRIKMNPRIFILAVADLVKNGELVEIKTLLKRKNFSVQFSATQQAKIDALIAKMKTNPFLTPSVKECQNEIGEALYEALVDKEMVIQVSQDVVFLMESYLQMVREVTSMIEAKGAVSAAEVRDHFNTSRKYALALLEFMDAKGITIRIGDERQLKK